VNILDNAIKYGPRGQTIRVSVHAEAGRAAILVDDQGPGIPRADRVRVFDRFVRLATALGPEAQSGTGIGLSVVRSIVKQHDGAASVEESPSGGVRLRVEIPAET
jgi:signal transduction histidine kinase